MISAILWCPLHHCEIGAIDAENPPGFVCTIQGEHAHAAGDPTIWGGYLVDPTYRASVAHRRKFVCAEHFIVLRPSK